VTPLAEIGTDAERLHSFTAALAERMNTIGTGRPWKFSHFRKTQGYANMPLDGVWLRAPYLHNGSVPTLRALLFPEERGRCSTGAMTCTTGAGSGSSLTARTPSAKA
jgi:hypothetical protein